MRIVGHHEHARERGTRQLVVIDDQNSFWHLCPTRIKWPSSAALEPGAGATDPSRDYGMPDRDSGGELEPI